MEVLFRVKVPSTSRGASFVAGVEVEARTRRIVRTAPILRRFVGQTIDNLKAWVSGIGGEVEFLG